MSEQHEPAIDEFSAEIEARIAAIARNPALVAAAESFMAASTEPKYSYNFRWMGRPIIQYPQDIVAVQELIWQVKPDLIIETGIAHGGSLVFSASMLALLDICDAKAPGEGASARTTRRKVLGVDIDIRAHNRSAVEAHPLASWIQMIEGPSTAPHVLAAVSAVAREHSRVLVCLDSNHTHAHVLEELRAYAGFTTVGSYCVVFDTIIEDLPASLYPDRPWGPGNSPKSAIRQWLPEHPEFEIDRTISQKLLISVAPDGYLKRTS